MEHEEIIFEAFLEACAFIRKYPPAAMPEEDTIEFIQACAGGAEDPHGFKYMDFFIDRAANKLAQKKNP